MSVAARSIQQSQPAQPRQRRMTRAAIKRGVESGPWSVLMYGTEGVGKSTWASEAPSPIFIQGEDGLKRLNVEKYPLCESWADVHECLDDLLEGQGEYKTVVFDTTDSMERLAWAYLLSTRKTDAGHKAETIDDYGYGKGYTAAIELWLPILAKLERLMKLGMNVILVSHSQVKSFKNPEGADFDRYQLKMNDKLAGLLKEWAECVLFATTETYASALKGEKRAKGVGSGARIVRTERRPAFDAKNRFGLPFEIPLRFADFYSYVTNAEPRNDERMELITALTEAASGTQFEARIARGIEEAKDNLPQLKAIQNWLNVKLGQLEGTK